MNTNVSFRLLAILIPTLLHFTALGTVFTVTTTGGNTGATSNDGSFSGAIIAANAAGVGSHTIQFNIAGAGPHTINCTGMAATVTISRNVMITGETQTGWVCGTPVIVLNGAGALQNLVFSGVTGAGMKALVIQNIQVRILNGSANTIYGCFFGTNAAGTAASNYSFASTHQLQISTSNSNIIGGTACGQRNVFAGANSGYLIHQVTSNSTSITGNYFGTDKAGTALLNNNTAAGIRLEGICNSVTIDNNVIVGCGSYGIETYSATVTNTSDNLTISNNKIGLNATGYKTATDFGNTDAGINLIIRGTTVTISNNTICDNGNTVGCSSHSSGIYISGRMTTLLISGNYIGVDPNFALAGNYFAGINVDGYVNAESALSTGLQVLDNVIGDNGKCSNESHGIAFAGLSNGAVTVQGNYVGVSPTGGNIGNHHTGIEFYEVTNFTVGGANAGDGNFIGFNKCLNTFTGAGLQIVFNCTNGTVYGNYIGVAPDGISAAGNLPGTNANSGSGINLEDNCTNITIGGATAGQGNLIGNNTNGIRYGGTACSNGRIRGNTISSNSRHGITFASGNHIYIGGTAAADGNIISNNTQNGINVSNADYIQMRNNDIYCNTLKGINLNIGSGTPGNNSVPAPSINTATSAPTAGFTNQVNGTTIASRIVEMFTTNSCASSCVTNPQGEALLSTVTATAGGAYSYTHGSTIVGYLSATSTTAGCLNSTSAADNCRTSEFSVCSSNILPVELRTFHASRIDRENVYLEWSTANEVNNGYFVIERSEDGNYFSEAGITSGAANSSSAVQYSFMDKTSAAKTLWYRLKQVDVNGAYKYSSVQKVENENRPFEVYPNPGNGTFVLDGYSEALVHLSLFDLQGVLLFEKTIANSTQHLQEEITTGVSKGVYVLNVQNGNERSVHKIVVE